MIKKMRTTVIVIMACLLVLTTQMVSAATAFKDIGSHWAKKYIEEAVSQGWINGYTDKTFKPDANITRAEFLKSLVVAMNYPLVDEEIPFRDKKNWYTPYIATGLKYSIIKVEEYADNGNFFLPQNEITREEIAIMTVRALGKDVEGIKKGYLAVAKENYIMSGYPDGSMGGERDATRAEAVVMIMNTLTAVKPPKVVTNPTTSNEIDAFLKSLPSFKGSTIKSSTTTGVLVNIDGTDNYETSDMAIFYSTELKQLDIEVYAHSKDSRAIVKDILKNYFPKSFEKAYENYTSLISKDFVEGKNSIVMKYDNKDFIVYKGNNNKTVIINIGV